MRGMILSYTAHKKKERLTKQLELEGNLKKLEIQYYKTQASETLSELKHARAALNNLITHKAEKDILFAKQRLFESANKPNRFLARIAKNAPSNTFITSMMDSGGIRRVENREINRCFRDFYTNLYSSQIDISRLHSGLFLSDLEFPKLSEAQANLLESPITQLEVDKAIGTLQSGKCPGPDGFPVEFFKVMKGKISSLLLKVFNKSFEGGTLSKSMYQANITLIAKKDKNSELCASYRPISLLGVDNKILSKILAIRLEKVMCSIVDTDQTGFIKGRNSYYNTRRLFNIIHFLNSTRMTGAVVSMDAEKAFDRVEWEYMFEILRRFGFGQNFVNWIKLLYKAPTASVLTNGLLSPPIDLGRGTAQGSPLSPLLFALAIEPLAMAIRQNPNVHGVKIGEKEHKILLYADDTLLTLTDPSNSLPAVIKCIKEFGVISGYKVNFDKSVTMTLGESGNGEPAYVKPFRWEPSGFMYLGVKVTPQVSQIYSENITGMIVGLRETMARWKSLPISFLGRINLIKMVFLPKILYPTCMLFVILKSEDVKTINKAMVDFIWSGRKPQIKLETLQLPKEQGGWSLPNIEHYVLSIQARILSAWIHGNSDSPWLNIETVLCKPSSPVNLLGVKMSGLSNTVKNNPLLYNALWAWDRLRKLFKSSQSFHILSTLVNNPHLFSEIKGTSFAKWYKAGINRFFDLFFQGQFKSFETLKSQYNIPNKDFYKYLQLRHYVQQKAKSLKFYPDSYQLESFLIKNKDHKHFISKFYLEIYSLNLDKLAGLRKSWGVLLKCEIDAKEWDKILTLPSKISICNRFKELQYNILHNVFISPNIYSKYNVGSSPNCPKCKDHIGTRYHCLWECVHIQTFWNGVCANISKAIGQQVMGNPMMCLLGSIPVSVKQNEHVVQPLLMIARKSIMVKWVGDDPPSISLWKSLIVDLVTMIKLGHYIKGTFQLFIDNWKKPLDAIGIKSQTDSNGHSLWT
uniref:Reverse transcriptase domain-containing protein n=1 Tax=Neogobius melanostomus TaxID=47308 RepID=A0A8C6UCR3_9GOBI